MYEFTGSMSGAETICNAFAKLTVAKAPMCMVSLQLAGVSCQRGQNAPCQISEAYWVCRSKAHVQVLGMTATSPDMHLQKKTACHQQAYPAAAGGSTWCR